MVSNMVLYMVLFELIYMVIPIYYKYIVTILTSAILGSMLPDNFDALNACFRDTVINILLVQ